MGLGLGPEPDLEDRVVVDVHAYVHDRRGGRGLEVGQLAVPAHHAAGVRLRLGLISVRVRVRARVRVRGRGRVRVRVRVGWSRGRDGGRGRVRVLRLGLS